MPDTTPEIQYDAFISYARADGRDLAERLYLALKEHGLRPWRDERDLNPYQDFSVGIERAIRASRYVIVLLTSEVAIREDSFVRREILEAQARHKDIIPLITADFDPADVPINIKHLTWLRFAKLDADLPFLFNRLAASPDYAPPPPSDDIFRPYVERLRDFVTSELEASLLNIHDMLLLRSKDTPHAVATPTPPALPTAFKSRVVHHNHPAPITSPPERDFDDFNAAFAAHNGRVLLLGEPGAGKTTTLLAFAREKAVARLSNSIAPLPIYAPLTSWDGKRDLVDWLATATGVDIRALRYQLTKKFVLLIFDGLDEMPSSWRNPQKKDEAARDFRLEFLKLLKPVETFVLISCRVKDYEDIEAKSGEKIHLNGAITLQALTNSQIDVYLKDQPELWDALQADSILMDMARTPLLLTLLAIGYRDSTPEERIQLRNLNITGGELRDRIFANYIAKRYEHEQLKRARLAYSLEKFTQQLGKIVVKVLGSHRADYSIITESDFDRNESTLLSELACHLHILEPAGKGKVRRVFDAIEERRWRFSHLLIRDYFGFQAAMDTLIYLNQRLAQEGTYPYTNPIDPMKISTLRSIEEPDEYSDYRYKSIVTLGKIGDPRAVDMIAKSLRDPNYRVRVEAAAMLVMIGTPSVDLLISTLHDADPYLRKRAVDALGQLGDIRAVEPLKAVLFDDTLINLVDHETLSSYAATALIRIGTLAALTAVQEWKKRKSKSKYL